MEEERLKIYIDGSAKTNPGPLVGCAGIIVYPESLNLPNEKIYSPYNAGTSGAMELLALVNALKWINKHAESLIEKEISEVVIYSDSEYVVNSANKNVSYWANPWSKNKWKKQDGGTVKHQSLWKDYLREKKKLKIEVHIEWHKGKSTPETKEVDKLAKKAAEGLVKRPNFAALPYKQGRSLLGNKAPLRPFDKDDDEYIIRVYSHRLVERTKQSEYEVRFETIGDSVEGRYQGFTTQQAGFASIDRGHYYHVTSSRNQKLPWIEIVEELDAQETALMKEKVKFLQNKSKEENLSS